VLLHRAAQDAHATDRIEKMLVELMTAAYLMVPKMFARARFTDRVQQELGFQHAAVRLIGAIDLIVSRLEAHRKSVRAHRRKKRRATNRTKDSGTQGGS
jgi:hypothetical protein